MVRWHEAALLAERLDQAVGLFRDLGFLNRSGEGRQRFFVRTL
jgi:hypothetical protein